MNKQLLEKYKNQDDKLLLSKVMDKCKFAIEKHKVENTDFLDLAQKQLVINFLKMQKENRYIITGGFAEAERTTILFYPEKMENIDLNNQISVIRITLPNELKGEYSHRNYLGALMKLGVKREKIGDILVDENGADIIVSPEIVKFLILNLQDLTRFNKATIEQIKLEDLRKIKIKKEEIKITVPSMRIDNLVSEIARCSRNKAKDLITEERVLVNFETVTKISKEVKENDKITIRGKGRSVIKSIEGSNKKGRIIVVVEVFK